MFRCCLCLFVTVSFFVSASAQNPVAALNNYTASYPAENVYLQLDNSLYARGDTIWFKAYIKANLFLSDYSRNLYVDWYDDAGALIAHQSYPVADAAAAGQFVIPGYINGKHLSVLAYTRWMLNEDSNFLFHKMIPLLTTSGGLQTGKKETPAKPTTILHFFPEGGNLVAGVVNKIAFKATNQYGDPVQVSGTLKDNAGNALGKISSMHDGMGYFYLNPSATTGYTVEWKGGDSSANTTPLPATVPGITMEVKLENNARKIIIRKEHTTSLSQIHLLATMDGIVDYLSNIRFNNRDSIITTIPVNDLPSGIITFTVLDNDWNPLAERVSFVMGNDIHSKIPQIVVSKKDLDKKGLNTLSLQYDDTTVTDISIAVTDGDIPAESTSNIISSLLLTGGLKGKVNNPAFYFLDTSLERQQLLDLVMLTNGWRKYQWHAIVNNEPVNFKYPRDSNYFFLEGSVDNNKRKHPEQVSFLVKNRDEFSFYTFPVSSNNAFTDSSNILFDTTHFIYHPEKGFRNLKFNYAELPGAAFTHYPFQAESPRDYHFADFSNFSFYKTTLPDVIVTTTRKTKLDSIEEKYASPAFRTSEGTTLELESPANSRAAYNFTSLAKLLTARLPGYWSDKLPVYVFVNESLSTPDAAMAIPLPDIAFVKYFPRHFVLAPGNGGGALLGSITGDKTRPPGSLAIYTKQFTGSDNGYYSSNYYRVTGYTISKEYYEPDYSDSKNYDTADERKTLYWNPSINLNGKDNKEVQVSFYNNDVARKFRIVMEGLKADGTPVHTELMVK